MAFAPLLIGGVIAARVVPAFNRLTYQKARAHAIASATTVLPEKRLYPMLGVVLLSISLFVCHYIVRPLFGLVSNLSERLY